MKVEALMTRSVVTLSPDETLAQAGDTLASLNVSGAPVCDNDNRVVGVFSKSDLVGRLIEGKLDASAKVGEHMTKIAVSLRAGDSVQRAVEVMAERSIHRLVVVDDAGVLVGIVSPLDIMKAIRDGRLTLGVAT